MKFSFERPVPHSDPTDDELGGGAGMETGAPEAPEGERILTREEIFRNLINEGILDSFYDALYDADFSDEEVDEFKDAMRALPPERLSDAISVPYELRPVVLAKFKKDIEAEKMTPADAVAALDSNAQEHGFKIGYHVSPNQITKQRLNNGRTEWAVRGYDPDDRDDGRPMAYYALDYENIYRKRPGTKYLYAVRAHTGEESSHQLDTSNNWGRAGGLSIIQEFDIRELEEETQLEYERSLRMQHEAAEEAAQQDTEQEA